MRRFLFTKINGLDKLLLYATLSDSIIRPRVEERKKVKSMKKNLMPWEVEQRIRDLARCFPRVARGHGTSIHRGPCQSPDRVRTLSEHHFQDREKAAVPYVLAEILG